MIRLDGKMKWDYLLIVIFVMFWYDEIKWNELILQSKQGGSWLMPQHFPSHYDLVISEKGEDQSVKIQKYLLLKKKKKNFLNTIWMHKYLYTIHSLHDHECTQTNLNIRAFPHLSQMVCFRHEYDHTSFKGSTKVDIYAVNCTNYI